MPHNVKKKPYYNVMLSGGEFFKRFDTLDHAFECVKGFPPGHAFVERFSWEGGRLHVVCFSHVSYLREIIY